ncbi:MAG: DUF4836 family protein [Paludibacteraceae bacterium]|nr:DUF4836 family protein [Paludibacteraceae bacterium]
MMKKCYLRSLLVSVLALFLASCAEEYTKVIPADSIAVAELDLKSILKKSNLKAHEDKLTDIFNVLKRENKELSNLINVIESGNSGIDWLKPAYMFLDGENPYLVLAVDNKKDLESSIVSLSTNYDTFQVLYDGEVSWIEQGGNLVGALTKSTLIIGGEAYKSTYRNMLEHNRDPFFGSEVGELFNKHLGDVTVLVNMQAVPSDIKRELCRELEYEIGDIDGVEEVYDQLFELQAVANVKLEEGKASVNLYMANLGDELTDVWGTIDTDELEQVPANDLIGLMAVSMNGYRVYEYMEEILDEIRRELDYEDRELLRMLVDVLKNTNGTAVASISGEIDVDEPEVLCLLPVSKRKVNDVLDYMGEELPYMYRLKGDKEHAVITNISGYSYGNVSKSFDKASNAKSCSAYCYVNLRPVADFLVRESDREYRDDVSVALSSLDYADLKVNEDLGISMNVYLTDDSDNVLAIVVDKMVNFCHDHLSDL